VQDGFERLAKPTASGAGVGQGNLAPVVSMGCFVSPNFADVVSVTTAWWSASSRMPFDMAPSTCCTWKYECRGRQARIVPTILLHFRHSSRSDAESDLFEPLDFSRSCASCARDISTSVHVIACLAAPTRPSASLPRRVCLERQTPPPHHRHGVAHGGRVLMTRLRPRRAYRAPR
jgi:hypothetical protein